MTLLLKDPAAVLDYAIDWGADYLADEDRLDQSSWSVEPGEPGGLAVIGSSLGDRLTAGQGGGGVREQRRRPQIG